MNFLIVGSGAREHTIAWKMRQSPRLTDLFAAPGNTGTAEVATNLDLAPSNSGAIAAACREHRIDLVVIGGEEPLADGLVDRLAIEGIAAFGPTQAAAEIEWSKVFSKNLLERHGIPTAPFEVFDDLEAARAFVEHHHGPLVIKADGLALGKGVAVTSSREEALNALDAVMKQQAFGRAGTRVVIEERLAGREVSAHAFSDGQAVRHMPFSCDHKPVFDGDRGPNTGGMGAYSPACWLDESTAESIRVSMTEGALSAMAAEGRPYRGVLYPGVMVSDAGPLVIEFNSRFGDPEAQVLLPRLETDLVDVLWATANNRLHEVELRWSEQACVGVVLASGGYPGHYETGFDIQGLEDLEDGVLVFQGGTRRNEQGRLVSSGGRVVTIVATGATLEQARQVAYQNVDRVRFEGMHYRRDIGEQAAGFTVSGAKTA